MQIVIASVASFIAGGVVVALLVYVFNRKGRPLIPPPVPGEYREVFDGTKHVRVKNR